MFITRLFYGFNIVKILLVTQYFWPENFRINDLALKLHRKGHSVTVMTGKPNYPGGKLFSGYSVFSKSIDNFGGIEVRRVPLIPRGTGNRLQLMLNYLSFALFSCLMVPFRFRDEFDVIFVYEPSPITVCLPAILIKKIKNIPIIFWVQDLWPESLSATGAINSRYILKMVNRLAKYIYHSCDLILVQSKAFVPSIRSFGISADKICYFPNSAEKLYKPINKDSVGSVGKEMPDGFRIVFAGNIGVAQSIETIIEAAVLLKENTSIHWVIIGDGRRKDWFESEVKKNDLEKNIHFLGQKPMNKMPHYFAVADLLLVTLKQNPIFALTIPSKIQSYLACGKPILAAIDGEAARIIEESGAGIAVAAENTEELAGAVLKLYQLSKDELEEIGFLGRQYFEQHFESKKLVCQLENWMLELK